MYFIKQGEEMKDNQAVEDVYIFGNLIEASSAKDNIGKNVEFESVKAFESSNAPGMIREMDFESSGARGKAFGARFKKVTSAISTENL